MLVTAQTLEVVSLLTFYVLLPRNTTTLPHNLVLCTAKFLDQDQANGDLGPVHAIV